MVSLYEKFTSWYLRFNGFFTIDNFVIHAADDPTRIKRGVISQHTEIDSIGIRMPYSSEIAGNLKIPNHDILIAEQNGRFDIVIAEVKSGNENRPNSVWRNKNIIPIKYVVRFVGLYNESEVDGVARELSEHYCYENLNTRMRYIIFANETNQYYANQGVKFITFAQIAQFLVEIRGQCWRETGIGKASVHNQWDEQIIKIFDIANNPEKTFPERQSAILEFLASENNIQRTRLCPESTGGVAGKSSC